MLKYFIVNEEALLIIIYGGQGNEAPGYVFQLYVLCLSPKFHLDGHVVSIQSSGSHDSTGSAAIANASLKAAF
jgi:hypothetical protein